MNRVVLLLGSNVGDRLHHLEQAIIKINEGIGQVINRSSVYETAPWGKTDQESFLNEVIIVNSVLDADLIMKKNIVIEKEMGRVRKTRWELRIIDIDILFYNDEIINAEDLIVPHPSLHLRKFTLMPLAELIPGYVHPVLKKKIKTLLSEVSDPLAVKKISSNFA